MKKKTAEKLAEKLYKSDKEVIASLFKAFKSPISKNFSTKSKKEIINHLIKNRFSYIDFYLPLFFHISKRHKRLPIWKKGYYKVYISHLESDNVRAITLQKLLDNYGITAYVPRVSKKTENLENNFEALKSSKLILALHTNGFHCSYKTSQEIGFAIGSGIKTCTIRDNGSKLVGFTNKSDEIIYTTAEIVAENIFNFILDEPEFRENMVDSLIYKFENSNSFQSTRDNFVFLQKNKYWTASQLERLNIASKNNGQIGDCTICHNGYLQGFIDRQTKLL